MPMDHLAFHAGGFGDRCHPGCRRPCGSCARRGSRRGHRWRIARSGMFRLAMATMVSGGTRVAGAVGVMVSCRRGRCSWLQHVQRFIAAHLAHDDAVRPHAEGVDHQLPLPDRTLPRPRLEAHHRSAAQDELGGVFDGDDTPVEMKPRHVEKRRLPRARAARTMTLVRQATAARMKSASAGSASRAHGSWAPSRRCGTAGSTARGCPAPAAG